MNESDDKGLSYRANDDRSIDPDDDTEYAELMLGGDYVITSSRGAGEWLSATYPATAVELVVALGEDRLDEFDVGVLARPRVVSEQLLVSVPAVLFATELQLVAEREQEVSIGGTPTTLAGLELLAEGVDGSLRSHTTPVYMWDVKPLVESPPPASTNSFTIPRLNRDCDTSRGYVDPKIEQHTLYQTPSQPGVSA